MDAVQRRAWSRAIRGSALTLAHKLVLWSLSDYADWPIGTNARPGVARLAEECQLSDRAVRYALERGEELGYIEQTARANPKGGMATVYRLLPVTISTGTDVPVEDDSSGTTMPVENDSTGTAEDFNRLGDAFQPARSFTSTGTGVPPTKPRPNQYTKPDKHHSALADARGTDDDEIIDAEVVSPWEHPSEVNPRDVSALFGDSDTRTNKHSTDIAMALACRQCDRNNFRELPDGSGVERCDHKPREATA